MITIWNLLMKDMGNEKAVSAIMGNLKAESGLRSDNLENSKERKIGYSDEEYTQAVNNKAYSFEEFSSDGAGYGLAQWTYWTRKQGLYRYIFRMGYNDISSKAGQVSYLIFELRSSYPTLWKKLLNCDDIRNATEMFLKEYERPADVSEAVVARRTKYATEIYDQMRSTKRPDGDVPDFQEEMKTIYECLRRMGFKD